MSLHSFSFSHRVAERKLKLEAIEDHKFIYDLKLLAHMFTDPTFFIEMGGINGLSFALRSDTAGGLRDDETHNGYAERRANYGTNEYPLPPVKGFWNHALEIFLDDMMVKVLLVAGIVSMATGIYVHPSIGWLEGLCIIICVGIVVFVGAFQNHKQEVEYRKLASSLKGAPCSVVRGGKSMQIEANEILVGDVVMLMPGNMVPADGLLIDNTTVKMNESALTGESDECIKNSINPFMLSGTELVDGTCSMLVVRTGVNSAKGKLMASLSEEPELTPLQIRLAVSEKLAGYVGLVCGVGTFVALMIKFLISKPDWSEEWVKIIEFFITSITVVIVAVPEGLPLAVTIAMAYSMQRMRLDQNLVKVLSACETIGNATTICSDKTGTLTQNKMIVVQSYIAQQYYARQPRAEELKLPIHKLLVDGIILNSDKYCREEDMDFSGATLHEEFPFIGGGGATETALLAWLSRYYDPTLSASPHNPQRKNFMQMRAENGDRVIQFFPFSSAKKFSATMLGAPIPDPNEPEKMILPPTARMYFKGAADRIIKRCTKYIDPNGNVRDVPYTNSEGAHTLELEQPPSPGIPGMCAYLGADGTRCDKWALLGKKGSKSPVCCADPRHKPADIDQSELIQLDHHPLKVMDNMTRQGLRCIAFAYVDHVEVKLKDGQLQEPVYDNLPWVFVGVVGIKDPLRLETRDSVYTIQQAGCIVRMVTGDNESTAAFIAKDCGIISSSRHLVCEGVQFRQKLDENYTYKAKYGEHNPDFVKFVTDLRVMARCHPEDKLELVKFLKNEMNAVVAVTGDGSNDGPALKASNVGLAMGIQGTDVSKAAADIIILDDNFSSIVRSVMWGRSIYANIRKFLQFQLSVNVSALVVALLGALIIGEEPLKPLQLLWINLVMDTMGALAIGTEAPKPDCLRHKPFKPDSSLISKIMFRNIIGQAFFQLVILLTLVFHGHKILPQFFMTDTFNPLTGEQMIDYLLLDTFIFNTFTFCQLFNEINSRKVHTELNAFAGIFDNFWFVGLWALAAFLQVIIIEFLGIFMETVPLPWELWLLSLCLGFTQIITGFLLKLIKIDPHEGEVDLDPEVTFEGAEWLHDPSLIGAMFHSSQYKEKFSKDKKQKASDEDDQSSASSAAAKQVYIGQAFYQPFEDDTAFHSGKPQVELQDLGNTDEEAGISTY